MSSHPDLSSQPCATATPISSPARPSTGSPPTCRGRSRESVQGAIEVALRRYRETAQLAGKVDQLEGALARRVVIERAKGILMERHSADEREAFELLRENARANSRRVVEVAQSVVDGHALLPRNGDG